MEINQGKDCSQRQKKLVKKGEGAGGQKRRGRRRGRRKDDVDKGMRGRRERRNLRGERSVLLCWAFSACR